MTEQTHTPGPWSYCQESADPEWWIVTIRGGLIVANVNAHFHQEANASLIAAAPEMLATLNAARIVIKNRDQSADEAKLLDAIKVVIAKAEVRS